MSLMKKSIQSNLTKIQEIQPNKIKGEIIFPKSFLGFQGHFPQKPILPGICKIQAVLVLMESWKKIPLKLKEIKVAKFFAPVSVNEKIIITCNMEESHPFHLIKAHLASTTQKVAQLQLVVEPEGSV